MVMSTDCSRHCITKKDIKMITTSDVFFTVDILDKCKEHCMKTETNGDWLDWATRADTGSSEAMLSLDDTDSCVSATVSLMAVYSYALRDAYFYRDWRMMEKAHAKFNEYYDVFKTLTNED